jgi:hypothetical protein
MSLVWWRWLMMASLNTSTMTHYIWIGILQVRRVVFWNLSSLFTVAYLPKNLKNWILSVKYIVTRKIGSPNNLLRHYVK